MSWKPENIKPYYEDDYVFLIHGNSTNVVRQLNMNFDLCLTDPPYGVGEASGTTGKKRKHKHNYKASFEDIPEYIKNIIVPIVEKTIEISRSVIITPGPKCLTMYPSPKSFGCFYQPATCGMQTWGRTDSQPIFYYGKDPRAGKTIDFCSKQLTERPQKNGHPCPKPIKIWSWLLYKGSLENEVVLDPFAGSGTTGRACKNMNRKSVMIESEEKFCEIIANRMKQEVLDI